MKSDKALAHVLQPMPDDPAAPELKSWALVELFGHQKIVGFLSQQTFGTGVLFGNYIHDYSKTS